MTYNATALAESLYRRKWRQLQAGNGVRNGVNTGLPSKGKAPPTVPNGMRKKVWQLVKDSGPISAIEVAEILGLTSSNAAAHMRSLKCGGFIQVGTKKPYKITRPIAHYIATELEYS